MFAMPESLDESLASEQPPNSDVQKSSPHNIDAPFFPSEREPLASHGPKRRHGITYAAEDKLPKLPIPELEDTCRKYQAVLAPLQNRREQEDTAAAVHEFLKSDGPELQARLKKYATGKTSYIEQFCMYEPCFLHPSPQELLITFRYRRVRLLPQLRQLRRPQSQPFLSPRR